MILQRDKEVVIWGTAEPNTSVVVESTLIPGSKICNRVNHWGGDSIEWLKDMFGDLGGDGMTQPVCNSKMNGNQ